MDIQLEGLDYVVRDVPRYGFLPLLIGRAVGGQTYEYYRGEFQKTPELAIKAAASAVDRFRKWTPPIDEFLKKQGR